MPYPLSLAILVSLSLPVLLRAQAPIVIDPERLAQPFEGWGVSLCWWANGVGRWSDASRQHAIGLLADPDTGLGYTLFRYNIGGGDAPGHAHMRSYGDIPGYKPTEAGAYEWSSDPYQRRVVADLAARVPGAAWEAFSNSPPWWMTKSGCAGGNPGGSDNLKAEYFDDFADYLSEVVRKFRDDWGIVFRTVTAFNEPSARWWTGPDKNQEGCGFRDDQGRMIKLLGRSLKSKGLATLQSASDENSIAEAIASLGKLDDSALAHLAQVNTHSYHGKERRRDFAALSARHGKRTWQSESGPLSWPGGNQMDVSLWMADVIIRDIREMRVNGWLDWQVIDGGVWGSLTVNHARQTAVPNKRYWMHANFSRAIRPGSVILEGGAANVLAALVPATGSLALVILNASDEDQAHVLDLARFASLGPAFTLHRTSENENLIRLADLPVAAGRATFTARARSISTLLIKAALPTSLRQADRGRREFPRLRIVPGRFPVLVSDRRGPSDLLGRLRFAEASFPIPVPSP